MRKYLFLFMFFCLFMDSVPAVCEEQIAFSRLTDGYWQIWIMNTDGGNQKQLTTTPIDKRDPVWIRDGQSIAFRSNNGTLLILDVATQKEEEFLKQFQFINNPSYCHKTDEVVFVRFDPRGNDASTLWKSSITGKNSMVLTRDSILKYQPAFSSKCDQVVFVKAESKTKDHHLWIISSDGTTPTQLTNGQGLFTLPSFSPNDEFITFTSNTEDKNYEIYTLDLKNLKISRLTHNTSLDTYSRFSPDGSKVIFVSSRSGNQQIWVMDKDGSNPRPLTSGADESVSPAWGEIRHE